MPAPLDRLSRRTHDVMTRRQLTACGVGHDAVARQITARRWQVLGPRIVVLHNGPLTRDQRLWAGVLNSGGALAGPTAAAEHGLTGFDDERVHIVVPPNRRVPAVPGVVVHVSRRFSVADVHPTRRPPQVRLERAVADTAMWSPTPRRACAVLAASVQQRLTTAGRLVPEIAAVRRGRHRHVLLAVLHDIEGGAQALSELDFVSLCRRHALPLPGRQSIRVDAQGRRRYLDADFDTFSCEIDGGIHLRPLDAWADAERHNALLLTGQRQLRFPSVVLRIDEQAVVAALRLAFERFGSAENAA
jgi:hypothetical protein